MITKRLVILTLILLAVSSAVFFIFSSYVERYTQKLESLNHTASAAFILPASKPDYFPVQNDDIGQIVIKAKSAVLFDTHSSRFLYQKEIYKPLPIASLTKLMTGVILLENIDLNRDIKVSIEDLNVDGYGADLVRNEQINGNDLLKLMLIKSSNDAALVFDRDAQKQGFDLVQLMNQKAVELGMNSTRFTNPAGLDDTALSTASDLVKLVVYISRHHKLVWDILKNPSVDITSTDGSIKHHVINTDQLLGQLPDIIGGKTGFTPTAMGTMILVTDIDHGFSSLIGVVLGSDDRFSEMKRLIQWGGIAYRWK